MLLIIAPDEESFELILSQSSVTGRASAGNVKFTAVTYDSTDLLLAVSGYGKCNVTRALTLASERYDVTSVLCIGTAGSLNPNSTCIFSTVICGSVLEYDINFTAIGDPADTLPDMSTCIYNADIEMVARANSAAESQGVCCKTGRLASADRFAANNALRTRLCQSCCAAVDSECGAIGQFSFLTGIPFTAVKVICNYAGCNAAREYCLNSAQALLLAQNIALKYVSLTAAEEATAAEFAASARIAGRLKAAAIPPAVPTETQEREILLPHEIANEDAE